MNPLDFHLLRPVRNLASACLGALDALVFPMDCPICGGEGTAGPFCAGCYDELLGAAVGEVCVRCAMPMGPWADRRGGCAECRGRRLGFDQAIALGPYQGPLRHLCLQLKHESHAWLAHWMADLLMEARSSALREVGADCVVPVPLYWWRRLGRGYNQAEALADRLARRLGLAVRHPLRRVTATPKLAGRGRVERAKLMKDAFRFRGRSMSAWKGRTVLLVDDILTTGATCGAAARTLKKAGAARVVVAVIARAEGRV